MKYIIYIFITILLIIIIGSVIYKDNHQNNIKQDYTLDIFTDTVYNYVIITTIANNGNNIGVSSIIVNDTSNN